MGGSSTLNWSLFLLLLTYSRPRCTNAVIVVPGLDSGCDHVYTQHGDINLGFLFNIHRFNNETQRCSDELFTYSLKYTEAFRFAIEQVNDDPEVLPNITLGWVMLDTCGADDTARALQFFPDIPAGTLGAAPGYSATCRGDGTPGTYQVAGVLGPPGSLESIPTAYILGLAQIPMISTFATTDELSDKSRFPYFARLVPPDKFQAEAMVSLALRFNWTYVSLVYTEGPYGESGGKHIWKQIKKKGLCLEVSYMLSSEKADGDFIEVASQLGKHPKARVVFVFLDSNFLVPFFDAISEQGVKFILICSDTAMTVEHKGIDGGFIVYHILEENMEFNDFFLSLTPGNNPRNPWMRPMWAALFHCSWNIPGNSSDSCEQFENTTRLQYIGPYVSKTLDSVRVLALGLHDLIWKNCPGAFRNKSMLKGCITGRDYIRFIKSVSFQGVSGRIMFNELGDMLGAYEFKQRFYNNVTGTFSDVTAALWDKSQEALYLNHHLLQWHAFNEDSNNTVPESVCSKPCPLKTIYRRGEQPCCWECKPCRANEIVVNQENCQPCHVTLWPDDVNATECVQIPPTYLKWNTLAILLAILAALGILSCVFIAGLFYKNKNAKLIRASSKELNAIILGGIISAYVTVFFYLTQPSDLSCVLRHLGFDFSVSLIYAPLLAKTNRIFRIFYAGKRGIKRPAYISTRAQMAFTSLILIVQIILVAVTSVHSPPVPDLQMPIPTDPLVELFCAMSLDAFMSPLLLNLLLIFLCAIHAFLTRALPENFNESKFIFVSVSTTCFLWAVFLPTYFTTFYTYHQAALIAFCLILNATITLLCLFVPKIYAVYFVSEVQMTFLTGSNTQGSTGVSTQGSKTNRVTPLGGASASTT